MPNGSPVSGQARRHPEGLGRKEAILLAAEKPFAHCGCHAVSILQIAAAAGRPAAMYGAGLRPAMLRLRTSSEGEYCAQLVARGLFHRTPQAEKVLALHFDPLALAFIPAPQSACPGSSRGSAAWAYQFTLGALLLHISDQRVERLSLGENRAADPAAAAMLIDFICAGISTLLAPRPARTTTRSASTTNPRRST